MRRCVLALALAGAVVLLPSAPAGADGTQTLSVLGNGAVFVRPDVADVSVEVDRNASTARRALSRVNRGSDAIIRAIRGLGIPAGDIQTQEVNEYRNVPYPGEPAAPRSRWSASVSVNIHITDITLMGRVIDISIGHGASSIDGPNYSFSDPSAGLRAATRAAIADARRRADDAAAAVGDQVTGVESMDLDPGGGGVAISRFPKHLRGLTGPPGRSRKHRPHRVRTNIRPGAQEVDAQVAIIYTIAPA